MERQYTDLATLLRVVKECVLDAFPERIWVKAEIREFNVRSHCYLTLSQADETGKVVAETRAVIWASRYPSVAAAFRQGTGENLRAGITVLARVQVNYSELYGISLFIDDIDPSFTLGEKALERKRILSRLEADGYLEMQKELALPDLPRRLAVITSATAAGYGDFRRHLLENAEGYAFRLDLFEALMQGEQAAVSVRRALKKASEGLYDAILILRGGGSESDLACFDDEDLAVAIATCPFPVVTAIGHDRDVHIADLVAAISVKTPTALADLFLDKFREADDRLEGVVVQIRTALLRRFHEASQALEKRFGDIRSALSGRVGVLEAALQRQTGRISRGLTGKYTTLDRQLTGAVHRLRYGMGNVIGREVSAVALKEALIKASDPRNILSLGYVLVTGKDNKVLKTTGRVGVGDRIGVRFQDGSLTARVESVIHEEEAQNQINIA